MQIGACAQRRSAVFLCLIFAGLLLANGAGRAADGYFPLWQTNPPNATDTVLIYQGGSGRLPWTPNDFKPYVSGRDVRDGREKWLFDGFLFIEYRDRGRTFSAAEGGGKWAPADKAEWQYLLDRNFESGHGVPALEICCAEAEARLGAPRRSRQVILTLPEPVENFTNWGELDGRKLDFSRPADRVAACAWHIGQALERWRALAPKHLKLAGFYFVPESISAANAAMLPQVAQQIHARGLDFFWIPYWHAHEAPDWRALGFDLASQQPNYFFHPQVPESQLQAACDFGRTNGMGMEMEFDDRLISQPGVFGQRFEAYLKAFADRGVKAGGSISYYEGGGTILHLVQSRERFARQAYDQIAQWVADRQARADQQAMKWGR